VFSSSIAEVPVGVPNLQISIDYVVLLYGVTYLYSMLFDISNVNYFAAGNNIFISCLNYVNNNLHDLHAPEFVEVVEGVY